MTTGVLKGSKSDEIKEIVENEYLTTFAVDTAVWPIAQFINFRFVPGRFQALYVNFISLGWAAFLSIVNKKAEPSEELLIEAIIPTPKLDTDSLASKPT